jgi:hypothetical protein
LPEGSRDPLIRNAQDKPDCWHLYPDETHGAYLVDFMLFEDGYGARIACESEWDRAAGNVDWDFDKLVGVKADIKVLIHQCSGSDLLGILTANCLVGNALISPDEAFVLVRFDGHKLIDPCWWHPDRKGPFADREIDFEPLKL